MKTKQEFVAESSNIVDAAYLQGWSAAFKRLTVGYTPNAINLLQRFADMYGDVPLSGEMSNIGVKLWRDYYEFMGIHMIRTDEGWDYGEAKEHYIQLCKKDGTRVEDCILDEVNAP